MQPVRQTHSRNQPKPIGAWEWCHQANRVIGEGDIAASYSADRIGSEEPVRRPFAYEGQQWVCVGSGGGKAHSAYRLVSSSFFKDPTFTYGERVRDGQKGRSDPSGFYHGMLVKHRGDTMVLCGPQVHFSEGTERQGDLFDL